MKYRWMQKKDFDFIKNKVESKQDFVSVFINKKVIAHIVEYNNDILGWIVYKIYKNKIKIIKLGFKNEEIFDFIIKKISSKNHIEVSVSEYDLKTHLLLKNSGFFVEKTTKQNEIYLYNFVKKIERI